MNDLSFSVHWTYVDQMGADRREESPTLLTRTEARSFAARQFADFTPDVWWINETRVIEYHERPVPKPKYGVAYWDGSIKEFPSKTAAKTFDRELPPLALQYRKGVLMSIDDGKTWSLL